MSDDTNRPHALPNVSSRALTSVPRLPAPGTLPRRSPPDLAGTPPWSAATDLVAMATAILASAQVAPAVAAGLAHSAPEALPAPVRGPSQRQAPGRDAAPSQRAILRDRRAMVSSRAVMQAAVRLAADGEIGNSDAIRLLQMTPTAEELSQIVRTFNRQLTPAARSKLTLAAHVPLPDGVENQRYEPIFDRYPITGKTYTTVRGEVVLNEVQYYNGEMVQIYGECGNVSRVADAIAGSGYKPLTLRYENGRETAVAQFWAHQLSDTSLRPYNAAFVIVAAVPDSTPDEESCIRADANNASSVLPMLAGSYDAASRTYVNRARLFYVRLIDSTQVAIDVGRERMGTDKRPGTVGRSRSGSRLLFSVRDGLGRGVAKVDVLLTDAADACGPALQQAARTAGITLADLPLSTECVYPGVARIGDRPVVLWDWRTDVFPRLQPVTSTTLVVDASSDDGAILTAWGFTPSVLGHLPHVRGVVTGVPDTP